MVMPKKSLQRYKDQLLEMRNYSKADLNRMIEVVVSDAAAEGEHDRKVSESVDKEIVLEQSEEGMRQQVLAALQRIEDGTFGQCVSCGGKISKARLDAIPFTPYCIECERGFES